MSVYVLELVGEDDRFAGFEAAELVEGFELVAPGIGVAEGLTDRTGQLAFTRRICKAVARTPTDTEAACQALRQADLEELEGSAAVRARAVRRTDLDTQAFERALGTVLTDHGLEIDLEEPDHELRVLGSESSCFLGWETLTLEHGFSQRRPMDRPYAKPGSLSPRLGRALANLAGAGSDRRLVDPLCGTGGIVLEAALVGSPVIASDVDGEMVAGTRRNVEYFRPPGEVAVLQAEVTHLPYRSDIATGVVFDLLYGRQSAIAAADIDCLTAGALTESARIANRAVVVAERSLEALIESSNWTLRARLPRRVHRSLVRHVHVLERTF